MTMQRWLAIWQLAQERSILLRSWRVIRQAWREHVTRPGRFILVAMAGSTIAGAFPGVMAGSFAFPLFLSLVALSFGYTLLARPPARAAHRHPARCVAGATIDLEITLHNQGQAPLCDIGAYEFRLPPPLILEGEPRYLEQLPGLAQATLRYRLTVRRRGIFFLSGPTVLSTFPFGLTQARIHHPQPTRLVVYPRFMPLHALRLPVSPRYQPGGIMLTSHVGESMEFVGNREYRAGDRPRDVHPRSWARVGYPVVRQYQEEFLSRIAILVDTHVSSGRQSSTRHRWWQNWSNRTSAALEANLSLAAGISDYLARQDYVVDLFAAGPELYYLQAGRSLAYLDNILDILACLEACPIDPLERITPKFRDALGQISTVILLLLQWDERRQKLVQQVRDAGAMAKLIVVSDSVTMEELAASGLDATLLTVAQAEQGVTQL